MEDILERLKVSRKEAVDVVEDVQCQVEINRQIIELKNEQIDLQSELANELNVEVQTEIENELIEINKKINKLEELSKNKNKNNKLEQNGLNIFTETKLIDDVKLKNRSEIISEDEKNIDDDFFPFFDISNMKPINENEKIKKYKKWNDTEELISPNLRKKIEKEKKLTEFDKFEYQIIKYFKIKLEQKLNLNKNKLKINSKLVFQFADIVKEMFQTISVSVKNNKNNKNENEKSKPFSFLVFKNLWDQLFDHQKDGVKFMMKCTNEGIGGLIADEMGLGKTLQTLSHLIFSLLKSDDIEKDLSEFVKSFCVSVRARARSMEKEDRDKIAEDKDKIAEDKDKIEEDKDKIAEDKDKMVEDKDKIEEDKDNLLLTPSIINYFSEDDDPVLSMAQSVVPSETSPITFETETSTNKNTPVSEKEENESSDEFIIFEESKQEEEIKEELMISDEDEDDDQTNKFLKNIFKNLIKFFWKLNSNNHLIICPATIISVWISEISKFFPFLRSSIFHHPVGTKKDKNKLLKNFQKSKTEWGGLTITTYDTLRQYRMIFGSVAWHTVILDEGQRIRNSDSLSTLAVKSLISSHRFLLSGSPIQNDMRELWSLVDFVYPGRLGTLPVFVEAFLEPIIKGGVSKASEFAIHRGNATVSALQELIFPIILRRSKKDVMNKNSDEKKICSENLILSAKELKLPPKNEQILFCPLSICQFQLYAEFLMGSDIESQIAEYSISLSASKIEKIKSKYQKQKKRSPMLKNKLVKQNEDSKMSLQSHVFFYLSILTKICNHPDLLLVNNPYIRSKPQNFGDLERSGKMRVLKEILISWNAEGKRVLLFSQTVRMLSIIEKMIKNELKMSFLRLDGLTPIHERSQIVETFNSDPTVNVLLLTTRVGGVGLNLTGGNRVVIFDPSWNPSIDAQAQERSWRIGQKEDVEVFRLISQFTVEEKIFHRQLFKQFISNRILDDKRQNRIFKWNDLTELFHIPPPPPDLPPFDLMGPRLRALVSKTVDRQNHFRSKPIVLSSSVDVKKKDDEEEGAISEKEEIDNDRKEDTFEKEEEKESRLVSMLIDKKSIKEIQSEMRNKYSADDELLKYESELHAKQAVAMVMASYRERSAYGVNVPTWTGKHGRAGDTGTSSRKGDTTRQPGLSSRQPGLSLGGSKGSVSVVNENKLENIFESMKLQRQNRREKVQKGNKMFKVDVDVVISEQELKMAKNVIEMFISNFEKTKSWGVSTGDVLDYFSDVKSLQDKNLLKLILKEISNLVKSQTPLQPSRWILNESVKSILLGCPSGSKKQKTEKSVDGQEELLF